MVQRANDEEHEVPEATLQQFEIRQLLGSGAFGKVYLAVHLPTGKEYAMKIIRKDLIIKNDCVELIKNEKVILF